MSDEFTLPPESPLYGWWNAVVRTWQLDTNGRCGAMPTGYVARCWDDKVDCVLAQLRESFHANR